MSKLLTYRRISKSDKDADGNVIPSLGLEAQANTIVQYCAAKGLIYPTDFKDEDVSGSVPLGEREGGAQLVKACTRGSILVVAKLDRLFRSVADAAATLAEWDKNGVQLVSIREGFDMTTSFGRAMAQMASVFSELERSMIAERTKAALGALQKRNKKHCRIPPYGYKWTEGGDKIPVETEQAALEYILLWRENGDTLRTICKKLEAQGVPTRRGERKWGYSSVGNILARVNGRAENPVKHNGRVR